MIDATKVSSNSKTGGSKRKTAPRNPSLAPSCKSKTASSAQSQTVANAPARRADHCAAACLLQLKSEVEGGTKTFALMLYRSDPRNQAEEQQPPTIIATTTTSAAATPTTRNHDNDHDTKRRRVVHRNAETSPVPSRPRTRKRSQSRTPGRMAWRLWPCKLEQIGAPILQELLHIVLPPS